MQGMSVISRMIALIQYLSGVVRVEMSEHLGQIARLLEPKSIRSSTIL
jgi:hypothetical protein